jgi:hypothetical protein
MIDFEPKHLFQPRPPDAAFTDRVNQQRDQNNALKAWPTMGSSARSQG